MREIKFRAWCSVDEMMYSDVQDGISFDDGSFYSFAMFINKSLDDYHVWEVMQYTGLKDKNGVEIYEGDILQNWAKENYSVIYSEKFAQFEINAPVNTLQDGDVSKRFEVIGNIYQNPELLSNKGK